jgi:hypothetical protein
MRAILNGFIFFNLIFLQVQADPKVHRIISWSYFADIITDYCENRYPSFNTHKGQLFGDLFKLKVPQYVLVVNNGSDQAYPLLAAFYLRYFSRGIAYIDERGKKPDLRASSAIQKLNLLKFFQILDFNTLREKKLDMLVFDCGFDENKLGEMMEVYQPFLKQNGLIWIDTSSSNEFGTNLHFKGMRPVHLSSFGDEIGFKLFKQAD